MPKEDAAYLALRGTISTLKGTRDLWPALNGKPLEDFSLSESVEILAEEIEDLTFRMNVIAHHRDQWKRIADGLPEKPAPSTPSEEIAMLRNRLNRRRKAIRDLLAENKNLRDRLGEQTDE